MVAFEDMFPPSSKTTTGSGGGRGGSARGGNATHEEREPQIHFLFSRRVSPPKTASVHQYSTVVVCSTVGTELNCTGIYAYRGDKIWTSHTVLYRVCKCTI